MSRSIVFYDFKQGLTLKDFQPYNKWEVDHSYYTMCPFHNKYEKDIPFVNCVTNNDFYKTQKKIFWAKAHSKECNERKEIPAESYELPLSKKDVIIIDKTTEKKHLNESKISGCFKGFLLAIGTPIIHPVTAVISIALRVLRIAIAAILIILSLPAAIFRKNPRILILKFSSFIIGDIFKIIETPIVLALLEVSALYSIVNPRDGKKVYSSLETWHYGEGLSILSGSFMPLNIRDIELLEVDK